MGYRHNFIRNIFIFSAEILLTWSIFFFFFFLGGRGGLTPSQRQCLITLICKDRYFHFFLRFWRPISLLNVDYKIVSISLFLRLRKALSFVVGQDQTCSVPGRSISDNVHLLRNAFDFVEQEAIRCAFSNLDQAKAFDRVATNYWSRVLSSFGVWVNVYPMDKVIIYKYF